MIRCAFKLSFALFFAWSLLMSACKQSGRDTASVSNAADKKRIYNYFLGRLKQTAQAGGYLKYRLVINNLRIYTTPANCNTPGQLSVRCFSVIINRTEYLDNYTGTYATTYTGDVYLMYRDEYGSIAEAGHTAGSQNTVQEHHPDASNSL